MGCIRKVHPFVIEERKKKLEREQESIKLRFQVIRFILRFTHTHEEIREEREMQ